MTKVWYFLVSYIEITLDKARILIFFAKGKAASGKPEAAEEVCQILTI